MVGTEAITNYGRGMAATRNNYFITNAGNLTVDPSLWTLNFGDATTQKNSGAPYQSALYSQFSRIDYSYADRYLLSGTVRRDGSSVFDPSQRWGIFPSVSGAWRISRESFFPQLSWLNDLKIRGGWGKLGSLSNINPTNPYSLYGLSAANANYDINGQNTSSAIGAYASQNGFKPTTWERDIITNIGLDATFFQNKMDLSVDWYKKAVSGLLFVPGVPATAGGALAPYINAGNIENKGIDGSITYHGSVSRELKFDVTGTFTSYNNKVIALPAGVKYYDRYSAGSGRIGAFSRLQAGQAVGAFYGYQSIGLFQSWSDVQKSPVQPDAAPGRLKFRDVNGDGKIDANDRTFFGNPNPKFTAGLNLTISYKNFDLSTFLYASVGNDVINYVRYWTDFPQVFEGAVSKDAVYNSAILVDASGKPTSYKDPTAHISNPGAKVPLLERSANQSNTINFNSYYMENGSFLRMKSLVLGYTFPIAQLKRLKVDRFRIYVQAANLFTITKYTGLDPELQTSNLNDNSNFGIDLGNYPANQKMFTVGVNLSF